MADDSHYEVSLDRYAVAVICAADLSDEPQVWTPRRFAYEADALVAGNTRVTGP